MSRVLRVVALVVSLAVTGSGVAFAQQEPACTGPGPVVWQLTAGQTINVGTVTVNNDATTLFVTYTLTYPDAVFGTLHLWAGTDLTNLPKTGQGSPIPGQFPYHFDASGLTTHTFQIPLNDLGIVDVTNSCLLPLYVVTHAEVELPDDDEDGHQTAFGGPIPGGGPRWWFYGKYCLGCEFLLESVCTTAFAKGGYVFVTERKSNPENLPSLNLIKNRWGWAINVTATGTTTYDIWAGAGLNKTSNGVLVGTLTVNWDGSNVTVTYNLNAPNVMEEIHIYAGDFKPTTVAPGQYGNLEYFDPKASTYSKTIAVSDTNNDGIWVIAHAVSCYPVQ